MCLSIKEEFKKIKVDKCWSFAEYKPSDTVNNIPFFHLSFPPVCVLRTGREAKFSFLPQDYYDSPHVV